MKTSARILFCFLLLISSWLLNFSISYQSLCNKLLQNLAAWNNKHLLSHTFSVALEFRSSLAGWFWLRVSHEVAVKMLTMTSVTSWRPDWGWRIHLHGGSYTWLVSCDLVLAGGLSSLSWVPFLGAAWVSSQHSSWFPSKKMIQEGARQKSYDLTSGVTLHDFCNISFWVRMLALFIVEGDYTIAWLPRGKDHWELSWNLAVTASFSQATREDFFTQGEVMAVDSQHWHCNTFQSRVKKVTLSASEHQISQEVSDWPSVGSYVFLWNRSPWFVSPGVMLLTLRSRAEDYGWQIHLNHLSGVEERNEHRHFRVTGWKKITSSSSLASYQCLYGREFYMERILLCQMDLEITNNLTEIGTSG